MQHLMIAIFSCAKRAARKGGLFILSLVLLGCATQPDIKAIRVDTPSLPEQVELATVPFFPQQEFQCGPAALATVLTWSGVATDANALTPLMYLPAKQGSLQAELIATARRHGRVAYQLKPALKDLLTEIAAGNPVLVLQNLAFSWYPRWHYAVVVGFDLSREELILRSGTYKRFVMPMRVFNNTWQRAGQWSVVTTSPQTLPATVELEPYLNAVAALELSKQWQSMQDAYQLVLRRWPTSFVAQIGLGNSFYQLGDLAAAEDAYRRSIADHPKASVAFNNLAQVLADQQRTAEAIEYARVAISLGGPFRANAEQTLAEILAGQN